MSASISHIENYLNPLDRKGERYLDDNKDAILLFIMEKGISFPTEISREKNIYIEAVNQVISHFVKMGFITRCTPDRWDPNPLFRGRMLELWNLGLDSFEKISRCSWWTVTLGGIEYLRLKYNGQGKGIKASLVKNYDLKVKNEEG